MARSILSATSRLILITLVFVPLAHGQTSQDPGHIPPEQLQALSEQLDRTVDQYVTWLTQIYELDGDQQQEVRQRLQEVKEAHLAYGKEAAARMTPLQQELRFYMEKARKGEPLDKEMMKDLQDRLTAIMEDAPLTYSHVIVETERLLPQDQVAAGRQRQEAYNERMQEFAKRAQRLAPPPGPNPELDPVLPYIDTHAQDVVKLPPPQYRASEGGAPLIAGGSGAPSSRPITVAALPLDAWGKYVEDFIARYKLDRKQAQQCRLILGELRKRADEYRLSHREEYAAAEAMREASARTAEMARLDQPIGDMFFELKTRLDKIPTDAQRVLVDAGSPSSQPARGPATRPAKGPSTRPAVPAAGATSAPGRAPASAPGRVADLSQ